MKKIRLSRGKFAIVDDEDFEILNQYKWYSDKKRYTFYAARNIPYILGGYRIIYMHNQILGLKGIDHKNGNGLDNQRSNLRSCTNQQNQMNRRSQKGSSSNYKGVSWHKRAKKWMSQICISGKHIYIGIFTSEIQAALAYDSEAIKLCGEFAKLNFPNNIDKNIFN